MECLDSHHDVLDCRLEWRLEGATGSSFDVLDSGGRVDIELPAALSQ
jgi:hypothetical protein